MKKYSLFSLSSILLVSYLWTSSAYADAVDSKMQMIFTVLVNKYSQEQPPGPIKKGLSVLEFKEESDDAIGYGIGNTIREVLARKVVTSRNFYLIDQDTVEKSLKEIELSQSGLVDDSQVVEAGKRIGVEVFITGSVSELNDNFVISVKIIDVASGKVIALEQAVIPKKELMDKRKKFAFENIEQYGLGINFQFSYAFLIKSPRNDYTLFVADTFLNYRPFLWLNVKMGVSYLALNYPRLATAAYTVYPDLRTRATALGTSVYETWEIQANDTSMNMVGPYIGADYNWTPSPYFTVGVGVAVNYLPNPVMIQKFDDGLTYTASPAAINRSGGFEIEQEFESTFNVRLELKPQYFFSPRMTVGLYLAYIFSPDLSLSKTTIDNDLTLYEWDDNWGSGNADATARREKYFSISRKYFGANQDVEDIALHGFIMGLSFNFYF
ncbi:MAG: hypothetical protein GY754_14535 [bacterium]|nr:hypothetical protein [bacterium]